MKRVLMLHDFQESSRRGMLNDGSRYLISFEKFSLAIETAILNGIKFESFEDDLLEHAKIEMTFDDGGGSALLLADFLKTKNIRGRFFIITNRIGHPNFLNREEVVYIQSLGHIVGSHSHTHPNPFCELSKSQLTYEILQSKDILENLLNQKISNFSVPGGEIRRSTLALLAEDDLDLSQVYTSVPYQGVFRNIKRCQIIGRLCIERAMSLDEMTNYFLGKGWTKNRLDYQIRRYRREIVYKLKNIF
jgi:peptidoglycan/xylan/chitin deacetylase (PgdA/CDA1 family)